MRPTLRRATAVLLFTVALMAVARPAAAHLHLESSEPEAGSRVEAAPGRLVLRFNEDVEPGPETVVLFGADGKRISTSAAESGSNSKEVVLRLSEPVATGTYTARWKAIGSDAHQRSGTVSFTVVGGLAPPVPSVPDSVAAPAVADLAEEAAGPPGAVKWLIRLALFVTSLVAIGGVVFVCFVAGTDARRREHLARTTMWFSLGAIALVIVQWALVAITAGLGFATSGSFAWAALLASAGLACIAAATPSYVRVRIPVMACVGAAMVVLSTAFTGHGASASPRAIGAVAAMLHTAAAAVWFGGLTLLAISFRHRTRRTEEVAARVEIVSRFSRLAAWTVVLTAVGGLTFAAVQLDANPLNLVTSGYGWLLLLKLCLLVLVLFVARFNRDVLVPAMNRDRSGRALARISRTVRTEVIGIGLALAVTAVLAETAPPA